jgi:hypothetical protein
VGKLFFTLSKKFGTFLIAKAHTVFQITANKMQSFLDLFIFTDVLHVSGGFSAHHQEHITVQILLLAATVVAASSSIG